MNFTLPPSSLQHSALVKIATTLWSQSNVGKRMSKPFSVLKDTWQEIEEVVVEGVSKLLLPVPIKEKLLSTVTAVGSQILSWIEFHKKYKQCVTILPYALFWTPHGTIDSKKSAEVLVKNQTIGDIERFVLACINCLIDDAIDLKRKISCNEIVKLNVPFLSLWSRYLEDDTGTEIVRRLFEYSALNGLGTATRYFYSKLVPRRTEGLKMKTARKVAEMLQSNISIMKKCSERYGEVLIFLLSTMTVEQQEEIFDTYTYSILKSFLYWPRQSLFLEIAKHKCESLSKMSYNRLLLDISKRMSCKRKYFSDLFTEFWEQGPETYKQYVTEEGSVAFLLLGLYDKEDEKNVQLILRDCSICAKKKLIFHKDGKGVLMFLARGAKWNAVKYLIQECLSSADDIIEFRDQIRKFKQPPEFESRFKEFFQLLDDLILGYNKRKHMEDKNTPSKRHCS